MFNRVIDFESLSGDPYAPYLVTKGDLEELQAWMLRIIMAHTHDGDNSRKIEDKEVKVYSPDEDSTKPVGFENASGVVTFYDHVQNTDIHRKPEEADININDGKLFARGWSHPIYTRAIATAPVFEVYSYGPQKIGSYDTPTYGVNLMPFPTYNMAKNVGDIYNLLTSDIDLPYDFNAPSTFPKTSRNLHFYDGYHKFHHYLYTLPPYIAGKFNVTEFDILDKSLDGTKAITFAFTPLFVDAGDTLLYDLLTRRGIKETKLALTYKNLISIYPKDIHNDIIYNIKRNCTSWLSGYKVFITNDGFFSYFTDFANEFNQFISQINYNYVGDDGTDKALPGTLKRREFSTATLSIAIKNWGSTLPPEHERWNIFRWIVRHNFTNDPSSVGGDGQADIGIEGVGNYPKLKTEEWKRYDMEIYLDGIIKYKEYWNRNGASFEIDEENDVVTLPNGFTEGTFQILIVQESDDTNGIRKRLFPNRLAAYIIREGYVFVPYEMYIGDIEPAGIETGFISSPDFVIERGVGGSAARVVDDPSTGETIGGRSDPGDNVGGNMDGGGTENDNPPGGGTGTIPGYEGPPEGEEDGSEDSGDSGGSGGGVIDIPGVGEIGIIGGNNTGGSGLPGLGTGG